jgi:competence protein ComEA
MDEAAPPPRGVRALLTTRGLLVVAGAVTLLALGILFLGARSSDAGAVATVTGAATTPPPDAPVTARSDSAAAPTATASASPVVVHVLGAVAHPGLLTLRAGDRVQAAIDAAGGTTDGADLARVNLARPLVDGEQLYVPTVGEMPPVALGPAVDPPTGSDGGTGDVVDLNTADLTALETLPGIGPALAARIIAWRDANGGFSSVEDLREVNGIGDVRFAELEPLVRT